MKGFSAAVAATLAMLASVVPADPVDDLKPGEWYEVPNSHLDAVKPAVDAPGAEGVRAVMNAWSGGAFDTKRDRLIVWGGGHGDYSGNEIYTFDMAALKWTRETDPSRDVGGDEKSGVYPDGLPRSRHTYNSIQYVPAADRFCVFGAAGLYPSGQTGSARTDCFDFGAKAWSRLGDAKTYGIAAFSAVDPITGAVWAGKGTLTRLDPAAGTWGAQTEYDNDIEWTNYLTMEADPKRRLLIAVGAGKVYRWNLAATGGIRAESLATIGGSSVIGAGAPGLAYDPVGERMVAWSGGPDVYSLDPDAKAWTRHARTGGAVPTSAEPNGTYGRFRYSAKRNVFVLVNRTYENVFLFRLTPGTGISGVLAPGKRPSRGLHAHTRTGRMLYPAGGNERDARGREAGSFGRGE
jgi:hypothetical protein